MPRTLNVEVCPHLNNGKVGFSPGGSFPYLSDTDLGTDLDYMVAGNARWVRVDFDRSVINTAAGVYDWANMDRVLSTCQSRNIKVLALPFGSPSWDRPAATTDKYGPDNSTRRGNFADFCTAAATRYDTSAVAAWEVWNEPNWVVFWKPAPNITDYIALLQAAYTAFKAVRTTQPVLTGGFGAAVHQPTDPVWPSWGPREWAAGLYSGGAGSSFDALAYHPYHFPYLRTDGDDSWNSYQQLATVRATMVSNGDSAKKVWLTEMGAPTGTDPTACSETLQKTIILDDIGYAIQNWNYLGVCFNYALRDSGTDPADREQNFGVVKFDRTSKEVAVSFPNLAFLPPAV